MRKHSVGFIGGGRVARIILNGWKRAGTLPDRIVVSDSNSEVLRKLNMEIPQIETAADNPQAPASCDVVLIGLHPPVVKSVLQAISSVLKPETIVVSLAPKISIASIAEALGGFPNVARMNPNAPSIVNAGYNPVAFGPSLKKAERDALIELFTPLGRCPEVAEELLESFAITTAMGPTYVWFQMYELQELAASFGIPPSMLKEALPQMLSGAARTMFESGLTPAEVMDLVPVKPLAEEEAVIKGFYQNRLNALYSKLKS